MIFRCCGLHLLFLVDDYVSKSQFTDILFFYFEMLSVSYGVRSIYQTRYIKYMKCLPGVRLYIVSRSRTIGSCLFGGSLWEVTVQVECRFCGTS